MTRHKLACAACLRAAVFMAFLVTLVLVAVALCPVHEHDEQQVCPTAAWWQQVIEVCP